MPSQRQQGRKDFEDNSLYYNRTVSTTTFKFPKEHGKKTNPLFFISLMVSWAKYKTTAHRQVRLKSLWGKKEKAGPLFLFQQEGRELPWNLQANLKCPQLEQPQEWRKQIQLYGKYKEVNLNLTSCHFYLPPLSNYFKKIWHLEKITIFIVLTRL